MAIHPYLFRFKPVDAFFFGGERSFGYDGERTDERANTNYFVLSNRYPQQTTLLGTLRYKLLEATNLLAKPGLAVAPEAATWIGRKGFRATDEAAEAFGHIHALSPLLWFDGDTPYWMAPFDRGITWQWQTEGGKSLLGQNLRGNLPWAKGGYNPKTGLVRQLVNGQGEVRSLDKVYAEQTQEGILKLDKRTEDEQGFYKQTYYRFRKTYDGPDTGPVSTDWAFGVVAWLTDEAADRLATHLTTNGWATMGGEGRPFRLTMERTADPLTLLPPPEPAPTNGPTRLVLLSDACVTNEIYDHCTFAMSETVEFRAIETSVTTTNYANLNRTNKHNAAVPQRGATRQLLLERGSVLYVKDGAVPQLGNAAATSHLEALRTLLDAPHNFRRIGYNAYTLAGQPLDQTLFNPNHTTP